MSLAIGGVDEFLKVLNKVWKLRNLDVALDNVARVQVSNSLDELLESFIILLLFVEVISMLLADLCNNFIGEGCSNGYLLSFSI